MVDANGNVSMKAAYYRRLGPAREVLEIGELPRPSPGAGEVRVQIVASGVNPSDVKNRAGLMFSSMPFERIVPHSDGAGVIDAVGEGVDPARVGERVWLWNAQFRRPYGTAAQWCVVPQGQAVRMPDGLPFDAAACLGVPALTAWRAVNLYAPAKNDWVLVHGGGGAVGHYAIQFACALGARVIATAGNPASAAHAQKAGAEHVIDYRSERFAEEIHDLTGDGVARIIDVEFGINYRNLAATIRQEGVVFVYGSAAEMMPTINVQELMVKGVTLHFRSVYMMPPEARQEAVRAVTAMIADGKLQHAVGQVFKLTDIASAHECVERRATIGNVVVTI